MAPTASAVNILSCMGNLTNFSFGTWFRLVQDRRVLRRQGDIHHRLWRSGDLTCYEFGTSEAVERD